MGVLRGISSSPLSARVGTAVFMLVVLTSRTCVAVECNAPRYGRGYVWEDSASTLMMNISIGIRDFAPSRLVCLAKVLRLRYSDRKRILIMIFNTNRAAKRYRSPFVPCSVGNCVNLGVQNHAVYSFDAHKGEEYVEIQPLGLGSSTLYSPDVQTTINLPVSAVPPCTLQLAGRCLLALSDIGFPWNALRENATGTVTVEGDVACSGSVEDVAATELKVHPSEAEDLLANAAVQNLKTWHFESARHQNHIRIVYSYTIAPSRKPRAGVSVRFDLPRKVEVQGTALK